MSKEYVTIEVNGGYVVGEIPEGRYPPIPDCISVPTDKETAETAVNVLNNPE